MKSFTDHAERINVVGQDLIGQELSIGDHVAFPDGAGSAESMRIGEVVRFCDKMVVLRVIRNHRGRNGRTVRRYYSDVVKVPNV